MTAGKGDTLLLFDVDGTLTKARQKIDPEMSKFLEETSKKVAVALVGGSDIDKVVQQMGDSLEHVTSNFAYVFSENGLVGFKGSQPLPSKTIQDHIGDEKLTKFLDHCLQYLSQIKLPIKRGTFVEFRRGMINISPIGRSCSQKERESFVPLDQEHKIREKMVENLRKNFPVEEYGLCFSIGGQISIDCFPVGWDKTYCLQFVTDSYSTIHFFGDKTDKGGNDHEIYEDIRTMGHKVTSPEDTRKQVTQILNSLT